MSGYRARRGTLPRFIREVAASKHDDQCLLWPFGTQGAGYGVVRWEGRGQLAHRIVCSLVHGDPPFPEAEAAHNCGVTLCVNPNHLRWDTHGGNIADRASHGTENIGERNGQAKLTQPDVEAIRASADSQRVIAKRFGVSQSTISLIRNNKHWKAS